MTGPEPSATPDSVIIRPYRAGDRAAIRHICAETADAGEPLENFFFDRDLVGDLVTRYYTDYCSGYSWVAERRGEVVGYLTAAPDTVAFLKSLYWSIGPQAFIRAIGRGLLLRRASWAMLGALIARRGRAIRPPFQVPPAYPAHLHINLLKSARGNHVGFDLVAALLRKLKAAGIPGVHATARTDNAGACSFFERQGFKPVAEYDEVLPACSGVRDVHVMVYARKVE